MTQPIARIFNVTALENEITRLEHQLEHVRRGADFWRESYYSESDRCDEQAKCRQQWESFALELLRERDQLRTELGWLTEDS